MIYRLLKYSYLFIFFLISNLIFSQAWCPPSVDESNRALEFDGINDFVDLPYIFNPNEDFTITFWYYKDNNLLAVDAINAPRDYMIGKRLIENKISPKKEIVKDPTNNLKDLIS